MVIQRAEAKRLAKSQLKGNWGEAVLAYFLISIIMTGVSSLSVAFGIGAILSIIFMGAWPVGMANYALEFTAGREETPDIGEVFSGFKKEGFGQNFCLAFLIGLFTFLWSLLLLIPGIIKAYSYSMSYFIRVDHPELTALQVMEKSKEMTKGYKWELFVVDLSFIGWGLLANLTLGIGYLWLIPYMYMTKANIYRQIKEKNKI